MLTWVKSPTGGGYRSRGVGLSGVTSSRQVVAHILLKWLIVRSIMRSQTKMSARGAGKMSMKNKVLFIAFFALVAIIAAGNVWATPVYLGDGSVQQADGTLGLPTQGFCYAGNVTPSPTDRPGCLALRFPKACAGGTNKGLACTAAGDCPSSACIPTTFANVCVGGANQGLACTVAADCPSGTCTSSQTVCEAGSDPKKLAWATSGCDLPAFAGNSGGCLGVGGTYSNGVCSLSMEDDSRNVATCTGLGGTWNTAGFCGGKWYPPNPGNLLTALNTPTTWGPGPGDQCLRCHNLATQYNGTDVRWVGEWYEKMGHRNMARKVAPVCSVVGTCTVVGKTDSSSCQAAGGTWTPTTLATCGAAGGTPIYRPLSGPSGANYPSDDSGNLLTWNTATPPTVNISGVEKTLFWLYGDWLAPLPRTIYSTGPVSGKPGVSYSCARCHTTGWTSDATLKTGKEPEKTFSGITWDGLAAPAPGQVNLAGGVTGDSNKMASWDQFGIQCSRCHISVVDDSRSACALTAAQCDSAQTVCEQGTGAAPFGCGGTWGPQTNFITNGTFNADLNGWTGTNWAWNAGAANGVARHTTTSTAALTQSAAKAVVGRTYQLTFDIKNMTAGSITPSLGGLTGPVQTANGTTITWTTLAASATTALAFTPSIDFDGDIDTVTLNATGNVCSVTSATATTDSTTCTSLSGTFSATPYVAPLGMGTHNGGNTGATTEGGYCSDSRYTREAYCTGAGATWISDCSASTSAICTTGAVQASDCTGAGKNWVTAGVVAWCSGNTSYTNQTDCVNNTPAGSVWWQTGWCTISGKTDPDLGLATKCSGGSGTSALTYRRNGSQASCQVGGATWNGGQPSCSIAAICSKPDALGQVINSSNSNKAACDAVLGTWTSLTSEYTCIAAGGIYTGTKKYRGQIITNLCMECHRQETGGLPYDTTNPATALKVGPAHNSVGFLSHPHGNQFLNSPHAMFTGTFAQIPTKKQGDANGYNSNFMGLAEARATGSGCTGCHNPHKSTVAEANPSGEFIEECTECHTNTSYASTTPQIDVTKVNHLAGAGTPLEEMATNPSEACESCHMPEGLHLWRINPDAAYSTYPAGALAGTVNANTASYTSPMGHTMTNAVWVDVDAACGQCHGGGTAQANTTGSVNSGSKTLTVASSVGFTAGSKIRIAGAGALEEDGVTREDLDTYILTVDTPTQITLAGAAIGNSGLGAAVVQNATKNSAPYRTKANLATAAKGMHSSAGVSYPVTFTYTKSGLTVNATAQVDCGGACPTFTYDWVWGDGLSDLGSTVTKSHTYLTAGLKSITLTVKLSGLAVGSATRSLRLTELDSAPVALANCTGWNANTWTLTVIDQSTDTDSTPVQTIAVDWGDGSTKSTGAQGGTFTHTYNSAGTYTVTDKAIDTALKSSTYTCSPSPTAAAFTIGGTVQNKLGTVNLASALVVLMKNGNALKTTYTAADGTFSFTNLKPATYTLKVTKSGYTFANPAWGPTAVGPDKTSQIIKATAP